MSSSISVAQLTNRIRKQLTSVNELQDVWVKGELSNLRQPSSGHWYFTLKDQNAQLKCVMFRQEALSLTFQPQDGDAVLAHGRVDVYAPQGTYQLYVDDVQPAGVGDLYREFELLKQRLDAEGLFDPALKQPLPEFPLRIGVVTSAGAAAFQDVLNVLRRRFPLAEVILSPTLVQGDDAPPQIVAALQRIAQYGDVDVIILCRGGGSIEDLWAFNDERVARAVFACPLPVVTGVGHEIDFTIVDFVADERAPTPSAAAELATPNIDDLRLGLDTLNGRMTARVLNRVLAARSDVANAQRTMRNVSPLLRINTLRQRVDGLNSRLSRAQQGRFSLWRERLSARESALNSANPDAILARGYAIITQRDTGEPVTSVKAVAADTTLRVRLKDGEFDARVIDKDEK
jgi:exodeoxyribonuclease VII large subunit